MRALAALLFLALAAPVAAQQAATLVADRVEIRGDRLLIAQGNVQVFWRDVRLTASRISYDQVTDQMVIEGPITVTDGEGVMIFADFAQLSGDLQDGLLQGARLVLDQQLQLAATEIARIGGRYTELNQVVASSCQVCPEDPVPLWSIRARRVIHDQEARQIYFEGAQLRFGRVPVAYIPRLRLPDPTLDRATGFLFPTFRSTSQLGTGLKMPYFVTLGRSADITLTPYLSSRTTTLELRYRQAFRTGDLVIDSAVSNDDILTGETRYYVFASGAFDLPQDFKLSFGVQSVSDDAYLLDYGYSDSDRLESSLALSRTVRDAHFEAQLVSFRSLRDADLNSTQPTLVSEAAYARRFVPGVLGGIATLSADTLTTFRTSNADAVGRDIARARLALNWDRTEVFGPGLLATASTRLTASYYGVEQDLAYPTSITRLVPETALTLRWPLMKAGHDGGYHLLEPVAMLAWSPEATDPVPNEDSTLSELDEGNLLAFSRLPGADAYEDGLRAAIGLTWTRTDDQGRMTGLGFGRLFRAESSGVFGPGTGLEGDASDWLLSLRLGRPDRYAISARALVGDDASVSKADVRLHYISRRFDIETGFLYVNTIPSENRLDESTEWIFNGRWQIDPNWSTRLDWRYDFEAGRAATAGLGLGYQNECIRINFSVSRRFTSSTSVRPTTNFGLTLEPTGFGTGGQGGMPRRRCAF